MIRPDKGYLVQKRLFRTISKMPKLEEANYVMREVHEGICGNYWGHDH